MRVSVNGRPVELPEGTTIEGLLDRLAVRRPHVAVAVNREVAPRAQHALIVLRDGDRVEVVHPMGGG